MLQRDKRWTDEALVHLARFIRQRHGQGSELFAMARARMFEALGEHEDATRWRQVAQLIREAGSVVPFPRAARERDPRPRECEGAR